MKAGLGLSIAAIGAALNISAAVAQSTTAPAPPQQTAPPPTDTVGPRELRDFSLPGTARPTPDPATSQEPASAADRPAASRPETRATLGNPAEPARRPTPRPVPITSNAGRTVSVELPPNAEGQAPVASGIAEATAPLQSQPDVEPLPLPPSASLPVQSNSPPLWPWFLLAALIGAAAAALFFRKRSQAQLANADALEAFVPVEPAPALPKSAPSPRAPAAQQASLLQPSPTAGIVSTRLRPWIDLEFTPVRCIVDQAQANIEFAITITNSGGGIARDVLVEAMLFNAGPAQDDEIGNFFAQPFGKGEPIAALPPLKGLELKSSVNLPIEQLRVFEVAERRLFVPLIGFNAVYRWSGGAGQTSRSFLVGREGQGEKMAPFRLDLGPRVFRGLGARAHHVQVRR